MDALHALSRVARLPGYVRPRFVDCDEAPRLQLRAARHPTLDLLLEGAAVPNDLHLAWDGARAAVITGPNMGGKSCLIKVGLYGAERWVYSGYI